MKKTGFFFIPPPSVLRQGDSKIQYAQAGEETANVVEVFT
jgi:hypothetical protein